MLWLSYHNCADVGVDWRFRGLEKQRYKMSSLLDIFTERTAIRHHLEDIDGVGHDEVNAGGLLEEHVAQRQQERLQIIL
jgi:hypothetical protein